MMKKCFISAVYIAPRHHSNPSLALMTREHSGSRDVVARQALALGGGLPCIRSSPSGGEPRSPTEQHTAIPGKWKKRVRWALCQRTLGYSVISYSV